MKTLDSLIKFCPQKNVTIAREITKIFEEVVAGTAGEVKSYFEKYADKVRGEFVVFVS
jgi:16S rRNA (cytidine1402-2'-O)-methyltransferase